ncbi:MAG: 3'-5' exonuclease [Bacteroidia bacterium]|nr:3'-5' exonuclease [Bacteroidia bacterium]
MSFLEQLNEAQREAVEAIEGPHMVIAGAGSGKTRVLTYRLAFILSQGIADPQELLALTFTNKAAKEMKERIYRLIGAEAKSIVMGTFHSIFSRILRVEAERLGYTSSFTILDSDDSLKMIKLLLKEKNLDDKVYKPKVVRNGISLAKNRLISPKEYQEQAVDDFNRKVAEIFGMYEKRLFKSNAMDFDDLLLKPIILFQQDPQVLYKYQRRFKYIMVDEYQDTNQAQYLLCNMLAAQHHNICVVGDDAQSIYAFRGANIRNILNLEKDYPSLQVHKLEQNYRSTQNIVNAANSIISRNRDQIKKNVFTKNESGEKILVVESSSEQDEAKRVSNMLREQKQLFSFFNKDFAILYRTNSQSRAIEDELRRAGLTYKIFGGLSFYQRKEVKDVIAYLKLSINPQDETAIRRVINYPTRGIGKTSLERINIFANDEGLSLWEVLENVNNVPGLNSRAKNKVSEFVIMIRDFAITAEKNDAYHAANYMAKQSGILKELHSENNIENLSRWENVQELLNSAQAFTEDPDQDSVNLESFLADISLFTDQDQKIENDDYITLMTIHSAKGLEFKSVFLVGMEENLFPSGLAMETRADLEEERRLFYVAVTRAEKRLTLSYAKSRYRFGNLQFNEPSRFLDEVDEEYLIKPAQNIRRQAVSPFMSPGMAKKPTTNRKLTPVSKAKSSLAPPDFEAADPEKIVPGLKVRHLKFGSGEVLKVEGQGPGKKATVLFRQKGQRVLLLKYAKLQIV